jgi:hypothetical protein
MGGWNFCGCLVALVINTKKRGNHVLKFMICGRQGLTFILANQFSLYWIQQILIWRYCLQLMIGGWK